MTTHHIFYVRASHPICKIREFDVEIRVCAKQTWALLPNGKRALLGSTAFYTRKAAERVKIAALRKLVENRAMMHVAPMAYFKARDLLIEYNATGTVH